MIRGYLQSSIKKAMDSVEKALEKSPTEDLAKAYIRLAILYSKKESPSRIETEKQKVAIATLQARVADLEKKVQIKMDNIDGFRKAIGSRLG